MCNCNCNCGCGRMRAFDCLDDNTLLIIILVAIYLLFQGGSSCGNSCGCGNGCWQNDSGCGCDSCGNSCGC